MRCSSDSRLAFWFSSGFPLGPLGLADQHHCFLCCWLSSPLSAILAPSIEFGSGFSARLVVPLSARGMRCEPLRLARAMVGVSTLCHLVAVFYMGMLSTPVGWRQLRSCIDDRSVIHHPGFWRKTAAFNEPVIVGVRCIDACCAG